MKTKLLLAAGVMLAMAGAAHAAGDPAAGAEKSATCLGCHGVDGYRNAYPAYHVPKLGGQHAQYIVSALKAYKSGQREHVTMQAQASSLSEQDMQDIAAYFAQVGADK
ncbi:Cytochrome c4 [wastewater metagenome]|uniref:Cytochrome c4 n=2 Tax=unclassified sequences TaxID=12908 RepID=A0A5B8RCI7_9ZZZZ|nr:MULTISPECIES: cytochrome c [Arhodomonas]MCS4505925.1 cytochrome c [Arhodomonas aquaeolei]QEA04485.1 cytochrome c4 [uncultured organism]